MILNRAACLILAIVFSISANTSAQGIKGTIKDDKGELLAFATIYIKELGTGTTTNADGYFEIRTPAGEYSLLFQYIGYESLAKNVTVNQNFVTVNPILKTQVVVLRDVVVRAGKEDPAYTIMRKAISKSKYHLQQIDSYTCKVYMKGTGELTDTPFLFRKTLEKEGVEEGKLFISESVSEVEYIRPNTYNENVISIRSSGDDQNANPNAYVNGSFYEPEVGGGVSPLSPRAFSYYKFEYLGTYRDRGYEVSKIKVTPRSFGDNVFQGEIEIVEEYWSIYSTDLKTSKMGINFHIKQFYEPIEEGVWLPVTHDFSVDGKVFGFGFEGKYLATVSDYDVTVNPELVTEFEVIDETIYKEEAKEIEKESEGLKNKEIEEALVSGKEVTRKQLRKLMREYEKNELEEADQENIESIRTFDYDSAAYTNDSIYWSQIRPVPLSTKELEGYANMDSLAEIESNKKAGDTLSTKNKESFKLYHALTGASYKVGEKAHFSINSMNSNFNTVDGYDIVTGVGFRKTFENEGWLRLSHESRYTFERTAYNGNLEARYDFGEKYRRTSLVGFGGRYIRQFNSDEPISPFINSITTLFMEHNYMKLYERDYAGFLIGKQLNDNLKVSISATYNERRQLFNTSTMTWIDRTHREYTSNVPVAIELLDTSFPDHQAVISETKIEYEPWIKYRLYNGKRYRSGNNNPKFSLLYRKGLDDILDSDVDFDQLELGYRQTFKIGVRALGDVAIKAGTFLNDDKMFFMDYKHFMGNRTPITTADPVGTFRMLPYYTFSTNQEYLTGSFHYQMRKFLVTRIPITRIMGIRESFFVNHLATDNSMNYTELGYGINYILRFLRVEAVTNWIDGEYQNFEVRIGIAANLDEMF
ncbi:MAG: DUF5686 and carboxypeptidase regulatory-like domain-containing protein [Fulvivirga sp.]|uniref:DUF5686 and carboxypeptidase regulatory-like domain-containing protein n=1 Tax=Fulvivirga sp. TaxID=1931237 RepID=UPI0032ED0528